MASLLPTRAHPKLPNHEQLDWTLGLPGAWSLLVSCSGRPLIPGLGRPRLRVTGLPSPPALPSTQHCGFACWISPGLSAPGTFPPRGCRTRNSTPTPAAVHFPQEPVGAQELGAYCRGDSRRQGLPLLSRGLLHDHLYCTPEGVVSQAGSEPGRQT